MKPVLLSALLAAMLWSGGARATTPAAEIPLYALSLVGGSYRPGGNLPETGFDCSGLVGHVYKETTGIVLPRDSASISGFARPLETADLAPGDLVFFNTLNRAFSHVGIYIGDDRFVHASSSRTGSVMVSRLTDRYWRARFDGARRVAGLDASPKPNDALPVSRDE